MPPPLLALLPMQLALSAPFHRPHPVLHQFVFSVLSVVYLQFVTDIRFLEYRFIRLVNSLFVYAVKVINRSLRVIVANADAI